MRAALACLLLGALAACPKGGGGAAKPKGPVGPAIDEKEAKVGASDLVTEIYATLGRGNKDSLFTLLEDSLIVFGPRSGDMLGTRADALVALGQIVDPKAKKTVVIKKGKLGVVSAPGGRSAWVFDSAVINGQPHTIMAVLSNAADLWLVGAVAVARAPAAAQVKAELAKDAVVPPGAAGPKLVDPDARPVVEKFQKGLLDQAAWGDELAERPDAVVAGPAAGEVARGKKEIEALWKKRVEAKTRAVVSGEITAQVTADGQLAWVSAPITRVEGEGDQPMPLRAFAVYEKDGAAWRLVALQESLAIGEPGAGAPFKKVLPPKLAEPKPVEVIADEKGDKDEKADKKDEKGEKKDEKGDKDKKDKAEVAKKAKGDKEKKAKAEETKKAKAEEAKKAKAEERREREREEREERQEREEAAKKKAKAPEKKQPTKKKDKGKDKTAKAGSSDEDQPKKRTFASAMAEEGGGDEPKAKKSKSDEADAEAEEPKAKKKGKAKADDAEAEEPKAKKKAKAEPPKKQAPKPADDDEEIEIVDE